MNTLELKELGAKMNAQDCRATQYPMFVVQEEVKHYGADGTNDESERDEDAADELLCDSCVKLREKDEDMPEQCDDCLSDAFHWFRYEWEFNLMAGVFLTAEACDEHIRMNEYHYRKPRSYGISAWRNYEMIGLMQHLSSLATEDGRPVHFYR
jgi:hypothetical protein